MRNIVELVILILSLIGVIVVSYSDKQITQQEEQQIKAKIKDLLSFVSQYFKSDFVRSIVVSDYVVNLIYGVVINFLLPEIIKRINFK